MRGEIEHEKNSENLENAEKHRKSELKILMRFSMFGLI